MVDHRTFGHGHPGQRGNLSQHAGPGLQRRPRVCPILLRAADCHGSPLHLRTADLLQAQGVHRLRVPGGAVRSAGTHSHRPPFPAAARPSGGHYDLRSGYRTVHHSQLALKPHHLHHRGRRDLLYRFGRHQGGQRHAEAADDRHSTGDVFGGRGGSTEAAGRYRRRGCDRSGRPSR